MKDSYRWENDPHLVPRTPEHALSTLYIRFGMISREKDGGKESLAKETPEFRAKYADWLKTQD